MSDAASASEREVDEYGTHGFEVDHAARAVAA